jgi:hypothetical protein
MTFISASRRIPLADLGVDARIKRRKDLKESGRRGNGNFCIILKPALLPLLHAKA